MHHVTLDGKYGIVDGIQAVKVVRAHALEWGISPDRIVFTEVKITNFRAQALHELIDMIYRRYLSLTIPFL